MQLPPLQEAISFTVATLPEIWHKRTHKTLYYPKSSTLHRYPDDAISTILKETAKTWHCKVDIQVLHYNKTILDPNHTLDHYGIQDRSVLCLSSKDETFVALTLDSRTIMWMPITTETTEQLLHGAVWARLRMRPSEYVLLLNGERIKDKIWNVLKGARKIEVVIRQYGD